MNPFSHSFLFQNNNNNFNAGGNNNNQFCGNISSIFNNDNSNPFLDNKQNSLSSLNTNSNSPFGFCNFNKNFNTSIYYKENNIENEEKVPKQIDYSLSTMSLEEKRLKYNNNDFLSNKLNPILKLNNINTNIFNETNHMQSFSENPFYKTNNNFLNDRNSLSNNNSMLNNINNLGLIF